MEAIGVTVDLGHVHQLQTITTETIVEDIEDATTIRIAAMMNTNPEAVQNTKNATVNALAKHSRDVGLTFLIRVCSQFQKMMSVHHHRQEYRK